MKRLTLIFSLLIAQGAIANDTNELTFHGVVLSDTCTISANNADQTVTLPPVHVSEFQSANETAGSTDFMITLAQCEAGDYVIRFPHDVNTAAGYLNDNYIKNNASSAQAGNVALAIYNQNEDMPITLSNSQAISVAKHLNNTSETTTFNFAVKYISTAAEVTPGKVQGKLYYMIAYN